MTHDYQATLAYSLVDSGYTTLARVIDMGEGKDSVKKIMLNILANIINKQGAGTVTLGDIPLTIEFFKTDFNTIRGFFTGRTTYYWKITDVDGNVWKGRAFISEMTNVPKFGDDDRLKYTVNLTPSDADWTFTAA